MLTSMRSAMEKGIWRWVLIIGMTVLMVSFAIWGIGDIFRGFGRERLVVVGNTEISTETFRTEFDRERQTLSRRAGRAITNDQARALGLHEQILQRLTAEAVLDERARQLVVGVSEAELARQIVEDPQFTGGGPAFNRAFFNQILQANNLTEQLYVESRRRLTMRQQVVTAVTGGLAAPSVYDELNHRFTNERRIVDYVVLPAERFAEVPTPTDEQITQYFGLVAAAFRAPEVRTADVLVLSPIVMAERIEVSDQDARTTYDNNLARWGTPERRRLVQLAFPDRAAADAAAAKLAAGTTFDALVAELAPAIQPVDLGTLASAEVIDVAVREAAFALPAGGTTGVIAGRFGPVIVRAAEVQPAAIQLFEAVIGQIKREMANERARRGVFDVHDRIEEDRLGGMRLADIAQKHNLPMLQIAAIDREGRDAAGNAIPGLPGGRATVDAVFTAAQGGDNEGVQIREIGGYVWVDVREIRAERDRPLAEVRDQVVQRWSDEQRRSAVGTRATQIVERIRGGATLAAVAQEMNLEVKRTIPFTRRDAVTEFSRAAVDEPFRVAVNQPGTATAENNVDRIVFVVAEVELPPYDANTTQSTVEQLSQALQNDIVGQYVTRLERELGATVNRAAMERILNPRTGG